MKYYNLLEKKFETDPPLTMNHCVMVGMDEVDFYFRNNEALYPSAILFYKKEGKSWIIQDRVILESDPIKITSTELPDAIEEYLDKLERKNYGTIH